MIGIDPEGQPSRYSKAGRGERWRRGVGSSIGTQLWYGDDVRTGCTFASDFSSRCTLSENTPTPLRHAAFTIALNAGVAGGGV